MKAPTCAAPAHSFGDFGALLRISSRSLKSLALDWWFCYRQPLVGPEPRDLRWPETCPRHGTWRSHGCRTVVGSSKVRGPDDSGVAPELQRRFFQETATKRLGLLGWNCCRYVPLCSGISWYIQVQLDSVAIHESKVLSLAVHRSTG